MKPTGPTNEQLQALLQDMEPKARESGFWKRIFHELQRPSRQRREVNIYTIERYAREGETVVVPGKVLSVGSISKKVDVAAVSFSAQARQKIEGARGKALSIQELLSMHPDGKGVRILG